MFYKNKLKANPFTEELAFFIEFLYFYTKPFIFVITFCHKII